MYPTKRTNRPFGFIKHNGLNFVKSPSNPSSRLRRLTYFLFVNGPKSKAQILTELFKVHPRKSFRGWGAPFFNAAIRSEFIVMTRVGRKVFYDVGPAYLSLKVN